MVHPIKKIMSFTRCDVFPNLHESSDELKGRYFEEYW